MRKWVKKVWSAVSLIVLVTMLVAAVSRAATVTSANDYPSSLETGVDADHRLVFTTPSGVSEDETIVISFDGAFDLASVVEDDVDVEDDGIDLTTAGNCIGPQQASVEASTIPPEITITICSGNGGSIAAGSEVTVRIGTGATASGTGANQIGNPADEGTYYASIAGTFGDSGSIALPMLDAGSVSVAAEVSGAGGGGGGGPVGAGGGCGDSTAPVISSVVVSNVTESSATVSWRTDENADGEVDYGTTASYGVGTETDTSLTTSRSIELSGLSEGTEYHFSVRSADLCANEVSSSDQTFTTLDETAPVITSVGVSLTCDTSASVTWTTNENADGSVHYGLTGAYGATVSSSSLTPSHAVAISGLSRDTTYHYAVSSTDASDNASTSADNTFVTDEDAAPSNVSGFAAAAGNGTNTLAWTNPLTDFAGVRILACVDGYPDSESDSDCSTVYDDTGESFAHTGLTNETPYYYGAFSYDGCGQFASGALATGTPSAPEEEVLPSEEEVPPVETPTEEPPGTEQPGETTPDEEGEAPSDVGRETSSEEVPTGETPSEEEETPDIPPTAVSGGKLVPDGDVSFFVANGQIQLAPTSSGVVSLLSSRPLRVDLLAENVQKAVTRVQLVLGDSAYLMAEAADGSSYSADVSSPGGSGSYGLAVSIYYADGTTQSIAYAALVEDDGYVFAQVDGESTRVGGATVTLLENGTVPWDGSPFGQFNPYATGSDGQFGWYVPNATYVLSTTASGYSAGATGTFSVTDNIAAGAIRLETEPSEVVPPILPSVEELSAAVGAVTDAVSEAATQAVETIVQAVEAIRDIRGVQETAAASTPALAVATVAATAVLVSSFDLIPFLQYFFTSPFLFFWRRKRRAYGVVYNSITKVPLDLATVRLFQLKDGGESSFAEATEDTPGATGRLVQSRVTDKGGRYFFLPPPGRYRIVAFKNDFLFPSAYLGGAKDDGEFLDVYHGEPIVVTEKNANVAANVPLDPSDAAERHAPKAILRRGRLRKMQKVVAVAGIILALAAVVVRPNLLTVAMLAGQVALYLLVRRLASPRKPKSWGIVYDEATGRPLEHVVARVFEPTYNKLLETTVTDSKGRYTFLLGPNVYFTAYEKPGFEPQVVRPIDYRSKTEPSEFSKDVRLSPKEPETSSQGPSEMTR